MRNECYAFDGYNFSLSSVEPSLGVNCGMSTGRNGVVYAVDCRNGTIDPNTNGSLLSRAANNIDRNNVVMVANSSGNDIAGALDASYYKGQGNAVGVEREYIVIVLKEEERDEYREDRDISNPTE